MKKFLFTSLIAAFSFALLNAQTPYLTYTAGSPGHWMSISEDQTVDATDMTLNVGTTGTGQTWNFQGLDSDVLDTINFFSLNAQESTEFPTGNVVVESNIGRVIFDKDNLVGLFLLGTGMDVFGNYTGLNYNPPQKHLDDINTVGTTFNTVSYVDEKIYVGIDTTIFGCYINIDTIQIKRESDYTVNFDSDGELRLPTDTFTYTLRSSALETTIDSIFIYSPFGMSGPACSGLGLSAPVGWSLAPDNLIALSGLATSAVTFDTLRTLSWYHPQGVFPFCIVDYTFDPGMTDTTFNSVRFKATNGNDIGFEEYTPINMSLYPNPTAQLITLQTNANLNNANFAMYNAQGQHVRTVSLNGTNTIDVSAMNNGMYYYRVIEGNKLLHTGKFVIKK